MTTIENRFYHLFGKHKYYTIEEFSDDSRKVGCRICQKQWAMNDRLKALVGWDDDFEKLYSLELRIMEKK